MTEAAALFWHRYVGTLPTEHPHRHIEPDALAFGDSPALANQLGALVQAGRKRATASLPVEFTSVGLPLPAKGEVIVVLFADGTPAAIIELVEVRQVPFHAVDSAFAAEGRRGRIPFMVAGRAPRVLRSSLRTDRWPVRPDPGDLPAISAGVER
jgi:uncharacterized protein YhfF